jgi:hypothetical protein
LRPARANYPFFVFWKKTRAAATIAKLSTERKLKQPKSKEKCGFFRESGGKAAKNAGVSRAVGFLQSSQSPENKAFSAFLPSFHRGRTKL